MNILEVEDIIKGLPDQALQKEAQAPSGQVPQFLVVSEIQRRTDMRKRFQSQQQQPQGTISQQIVQEGIASIAPPPQQMMPQQPMPQQQPMPPQQMPMQQMPQGNPQTQLPAQPMYRGGVVEMNQGRQATIGPLEEEEEEELYPGVLMGGRNPMSIRQFNQDFLGETGTYSTPSGGEFVEYESPEYSFRAADRVLTTYGRDQGINTIRDAISRYAPPSDDNPTENYIDFVSKQSGIDPDQEIDFSDPITRSNLIAPMAQFESRTTISPSGVRDSIASVDQDYAANLPERRMNALSPEVQSNVQVPTEGFPVPSVQTEDPRLNIPSVNIEEVGRENQYAGVESTEALLDAIMEGKSLPVRKGRERQGTVARLPEKGVGAATTAISNAIESDANRTSEKDIKDKEQIEMVESFKQVDPYALVGGVIQSALPVVVDKKVKKSQDPYALVGDIIQQAQPRKTARKPEDPYAVLGDIIQSAQPRKNNSEVFIPATDPYAMVGDVTQAAQPRKEDPSLLDIVGGRIKSEFEERPLAKYIQRYSQIREAGIDPETGEYDYKKGRAKAEEFRREDEIAAGVDPDYEPVEMTDYAKSRQAEADAVLDRIATESSVAPDTDQRIKEREDLFAGARRAERALQPPSGDAEKGGPAGTGTTTTAPTTRTTPEGSATTPPPATRSGDQGVAALMSDYGRTRDEAKREAFANAMIQLGAGVAKGDLSAGLSAAGKAAAETMKDFRKEKLDQRRLDIMKDRYDQYASSTSPYNSLLLRVRGEMDTHFEDPRWRVLAKQAGKTEDQYKRDYYDSLIRKHAPGFNLDPEEIINRGDDPFAGPQVEEGRVVSPGGTYENYQLEISP